MCRAGHHARRRGGVSDPAAAGRLIDPHRRLYSETCTGDREGVMFYALGFERVGVVMGDLYFIDPDPLPGQEGAERGVRLEVRLLEAALFRGRVVDPAG